MVWELPTFALRAVAVHVPALRPGHYSRLHGLQNFRSEFEGLSAADDGGMTAIIARIKTSLTEPSTPAVAEVRL